MRTPFTRHHARSNTRHHLFFEKPDWNANHYSQRVRELGTFVVAVKRAPHDYLHSHIQPPAVPVKAVCDAAFELGREFVGWQNDNDRLDRVLDGMTGFAKAARSPEQADGMWNLCTSISGQLAVVNFFKAAQPRYE